MTEVEKEKSIENYPKPITIEGTIKIVDQLKIVYAKYKIKMVMELGFFVKFHIKKKS